MAEGLGGERGATQHISYTNRYNIFAKTSCTCKYMIIAKPHVHAARHGVPPQVQRALLGRSVGATTLVCQAATDGLLGQPASTG